MSTALAIAARSSHSDAVVLACQRAHVAGDELDQVGLTLGAGLLEDVL
jgi:hypothetical protein